MTQALYAQMKNKTIKKKERRSKKRKEEEKNYPVWVDVACLQLR
jgi:hypothetical protein